MKRNVILSAVAVVLLALVFGPGLLLLLPVIPIANYFIRRKEEEKPQRITYETVDEVEQRYGEPDDVVVLNAARANELSSLILFFTSHDVVIVAGEELRISDVVSVAAKNLATPYTIDEQAVVIGTRIPDRSVIRLRVGYDGGLARQIAAQVNSHIVHARQ